MCMGQLSNRISVLESSERFGSKAEFYESLAFRKSFKGIRWGDGNKMMIIEKRSLSSRAL